MLDREKRLNEVYEHVHRYFTIHTKGEFADYIKYARAYTLRTAHPSPRSRYQMCPCAATASRPTLASSSAMPVCSRSRSTMRGRMTSPSAGRHKNGVAAATPSDY